MRRRALAPVRRRALTPSRLAGARLAGALLAAAAVVSAGSAPGMTSRAAPGELRLRGDWEAPDAVVLGRQDLWSAAFDSLSSVLGPGHVRVVTPGESGWTGRHESAWVRDYGPLQASRDGESVWLDAGYHPGRPVDDSLPARLGSIHEVRVERLPYALDGGGVVSDGRGLCVMTESTLRRLGPPGGIDPSRIAQRLGCRELVVVPALRDEPTGHVDLLIQFLAPDLVAVAEPHGDWGASDARARLNSAVHRLAGAAQAANRPLRVVRLPMFRGPQGEFLSYVNVVALGDRLLVPDFSSVPPSAQATAYALLERASRKRVVPIPADEIALVGGGLHCIVLGLFG